MKNIESPRDYFRLSTVSRILKDDLENCFYVDAPIIGEKRLMVEVLRRSIEDYRNRDLDISWFTNGEDHLFSFSNICNTLGISEQTIIRLLYTF